MVAQTGDMLHRTSGVDPTLFLMGMEWGESVPQSNARFGRFREGICGDNFVGDGHSWQNGHELYDDELLRLRRN